MGSNVVLWLRMRCQTYWMVGLVHLQRVFEVLVWIYAYPFEGKPTWETQFSVASWLHLHQPKLNIYVSWSCELIHLSRLNATCTFQVHHLCEAGGGSCHWQNEAETTMRMQGGTIHLLAPCLSMLPSVSSFPLARSCTNCQMDKTVQPDYKINWCGKCKLIRFMGTMAAYILMECTEN